MSQKSQLTKNLISSRPNRASNLSNFDFLKRNAFWDSKITATNRPKIFEKQKRFLIEWGLKHFAELKDSQLIEDLTFSLEKTDSELKTQNFKFKKNSEKINFQFRGHIARLPDKLKLKKRGDGLWSTDVIFKIFFGFFWHMVNQRHYCTNPKKDLEWLTPSYEKEFFWFSSPIARFPFLVSITRNRSFRV